MENVSQIHVPTSLVPKIRSVKMAVVCLNAVQQTLAKVIVFVGLASASIHLVRASLVQQEPPAIKTQGTVIHPQAVVTSTRISVPTMMSVSTASVSHLDVIPIKPVVKARSVSKANVKIILAKTNSAKRTKHVAPTMVFVFQFVIVKQAKSATMVYVKPIPATEKPVHKVKSVEMAIVKQNYRVTRQKMPTTPSVNMAVFVKTTLSTSAHPKPTVEIIFARA